MQEPPKFQCLIFNSTTDQDSRCEVIMFKKQGVREITLSTNYIVYDKKNAHFTTQ